MLSLDLPNCLEETAVIYVICLEILTIGILVGFCLPVVTRYEVFGVNSFAVNWMRRRWRSVVLTPIALIVVATILGTEEWSYYFSNMECPSTGISIILIGHSILIVLWVRTIRQVLSRHVVTQVSRFYSDRRPGHCGICGKETERFADPTCPACEGSVKG